MLHDGTGMGQDKSDRRESDEVIDKEDKATKSNYKVLRTCQYSTSSGDG